ncbi:methyltransferase domain-containing protein [uncultured Methylobacterium sp.]|jgi:hypothetical protein|uniref:methyltransferase domain-containing protein n=1 Tax=uncultured Methylobacterium sp. TaxID=157278 RepID=UPI0026293066|nr:methyltransferase domain-containing protein [uncultured Methylobacterium sp.]
MGSAIDTFTLVRGAIVAVGWTSGWKPRLLYGGRAVPAVCRRVERDDLVAAFGPKAAGWGFILTGVAPTPDPDPAQVALRFSRREVVTLADRAARNDDHALFRKFVALAHERGGSIVEIGSRARSGTVYRTAFPPDMTYVGVDVAAGDNVDVVGDAHHLSRHLTRTFDFALSISVFEHLLMPWKAAIELGKVLNDGGIAFIASHQAWPLHETPWDFWRFSDNAWRGLFNRHTGFEVLDTEMSAEGFLVPVLSAPGSLRGIDRQRTFLSSACLVRKVAPATVAWEAEASEIYDLNYSH